MKDILVRWLRALFATVPDVGRATTEPDPSVVYKATESDLVISTWMGARLYLYVIDEKAPRVRDLRQLLRTNSGNGIGTLFVVNQKLLPDEDWVGRLDDWYDALMSLNDGFIYTYRLTDDGFKLEQTHFTAAPVKDEYRCWVFEDFAIENVSVRVRETNGALRGKWRVGDIASPSYRRKMNYERVNQRYHYRTKYTQEIPNSQQQHKQQTGSLAQRERRLQQYYKLLGVDANASEKEIKRAFRQRALMVHPDVSALPRQEANERIKQLNAAYEFIKEHHGWK